MTLYYGVHEGRMYRSTWQFGMYFEANLNLDPGAINTWSAFNFDVFVQNTDTPTGYISWMGLNQFSTGQSVYIVDSATDRKLDKVSAAGWGEGTDAFAEELPPTLTPIVLLDTLPPSPLHGRIYMPPCTDTPLAATTFNLSSAQALHGWFTTAIAHMATLGATPVVRSRTRHLSKPVSAIRVSEKWGHLSSRQSSFPTRYG